MVRKQNIGKCDTCKKEFHYYMVHNGFNNTSYAYCSECGMTAFFDLVKIPKSITVSFGQGAIPEAAEALLKKCQCGGKFTRNAKPRCPHCLNELSAETATSYLQANASKGWLWLKKWTGVDCIIIENRKTYEPWK